MNDAAYAVDPSSPVDRGYNANMAIVAVVVGINEKCPDSRDT